MNKEELINKLKDENLSTEETIQLRGQLIKILKKEIKNTQNNKTIIPLRLQLYEELKKHKEALKRRGQEETISIPKRVALKVKEIANTISLFKEKHDLVGKAKNAAIGTTVSSLFAGAVTVGLTLLGGAPVTLATLAAAIPTICYCGLSSIIRMPFTDTGWTKLIKSVETKDKNKELIISFIENNVKNDKELSELLKKKSTKLTEKELIETNNLLLIKYQALISKAPLPELTKMLKFEQINLLTEQKQIFEKIKKEYIKSKRELTLKQFTEVEKTIVSLDLTIAKENSFISEVAKETGKNLAISSGTVLAARGIMSALFPSYAISDIASLGMPLIFTAISNIANMGELKEKIRLEKEAYDKLKVNIDKKKLQEAITKEQTSSLALT